MVSTLFLDIGGVLLTNGWDRAARAGAASMFNFDINEMEERHHLTFDVYESGKITLNEYLNRILFYKDQAFSKKEFIDFMFSQSLQIENSFDFFKKIKNKYRLKVYAVNNEGRELHDFRIQKFNLRELFDAFFTSGYVQMRKPDPGFFRLAIDLSGEKPEKILFIDDRKLFTEVAKEMGMQVYHFNGTVAANEYFKLSGMSLE